MDIDYKYTWVLPKNRWYIKLYTWLWNADPKEITFCKLTWGYLLLWMGIPYKLISSTLAALHKVIKVAKEIAKEGRESREPRLRTEKPVKVKLGPSMGARMVGRVEMIVSRIVMLCHTRPMAILGRIVSFVAAVAVGLAISWAVYLFFTIRHLFPTLAHAGAALGQLAVHNAAPIGLVSVGLILFVGLVYFILISGLALAFFQVLLKPTAIGTKKGTLGFGRMMVIGIKSIKSNTCPRVIVED